VWRHLQSFSSLPANPKDSGLSPLAKKLRLKPDHIVAILNAPPGYLETLEPGPATILTELKADHAYDAVQLFVNNADELRRLSGAVVAALKPEGLLWITHPKNGWRNETVGQTFVDTGYMPVTLVKIDETWTAVRLKKG
jgi:hypothetical protein